LPLHDLQFVRIDLLGRGAPPHVCRLNRQLVQLGGIAAADIVPGIERGKGVAGARHAQLAARDSVPVNLAAFQCQRRDAIGLVGRYADRHQHLHACSLLQRLGSFQRAVPPLTVRPVRLVSWKMF
jgi:hypothetical protein